MLEQMAVIDECPHDVGIAKIHAQLDARIGGAAPVPVRDVYGVPEESVIDANSVSADKKKMDLVDVESMKLAGAVLDDPVLNIALMDDDIGR